jgi:hypothetical protein
MSVSEWNLVRFIRGSGILDRYSITDAAFSQSSTWATLFRLGIQAQDHVGAPHAIAPFWLPLIYLK